MIASLVSAAKGLARKMYGDLSQPRITYGELGQIFTALDDSEVLQTYRAAMRELAPNTWDVVKRTRMPFEHAEANLGRLTELGLVDRHDHEQIPGDTSIYYLTPKGLLVARRYM